MSGMNNKKRATHGEGEHSLLTENCGCGITEANTQEKVLDDTDLNSISTACGKV